MKHETKLGLVFIGILLTIFIGLLMKRLARPGNAVLSNARPPAATGSAEAAPAKLGHQPAPPTLVTPKAQSGKPPESVAAETPAHRGEKHSPATKPNRPIAQDPPASSAATPSDPAPSLLATPLPITEVGDRYANRSRDPFDGAAANSSDSKSGQQPYRSGYADTNDSHVDSAPEPAATYRQPNRSGAGNAKASASPTTVDRYTTSPRAEVYPIAVSDPPAPTQHYSTANVAVASTGAIVPAAGIQRDGDKYTVLPNDSFWTISEKAYGSGGFFKALYEHNRKLHPEVDEMKVGQVLTVPDESVLRRAYPDLCPKPRLQMPGVQQRLASASGRMRSAGRAYTVEDGDTLFEIARRELGKTSRWAEIYDLNHDVLGNDFDYLRPGLELILPDEKQRGENVTRQPNSVYPR